MISISDKIRKDQMVMDLTKTSLISHVIATTDKGSLTLNLRKGEVSYFFSLDSVPFDSKINRELLEAFDGVLYEL